MRTNHDKSHIGVGMLFSQEMRAAVCRIRDKESELDEVVAVNDRSEALRSTVLDKETFQVKKTGFPVNK